jgi:hypothetical protein
MLTGQLITSDKRQTLRLLLDDTHGGFHLRGVPLWDVNWSAVR